MVIRQRSSVIEESSDDEDIFVETKTKRLLSGQRSSYYGSRVTVAESRVRKVILRCAVGILMVSSFLGIVWLGHLYVSALVVLIQVSASFRACLCSHVSMLCVVVCVSSLLYVLFFGKNVKMETQKDRYLGLFL